MEKKPSSPLVRIWKWLDNYWYHYKTPTLIFGFLAITILICVAQMITKTEADAYVLYAGPEEFTPNEVREIQNAFQLVMENDANGDGQKQTEIINLLLMTDEQIAQAQENAAAEGLVLVYNSQTIKENQNKFTSHLLSGEASILLLDPSWYDSIKKNGGFARLADVLGSQPEFALDDYTVRLKDTLFGQYFTAFDSYPDDTLLCLRIQSTVSSFKSLNKQDVWYENQVKLFRSLFAFDLVPETTAPEETLPEPAETLPEPAETVQ